MVRMLMRRLLLGLILLLLTLLLALLLLMYRPWPFANRIATGRRAGRQDWRRSG